MNAFNLALCIAPNMLWLPSPTGPEEESRSTKKVIFHRFGFMLVFSCILWALYFVKEGIGSVPALADGIRTSSFPLRRGACAGRGIRRIGHSVYPGWKGKLWLLYQMNLLSGQASARKLEQLKLDTATSAGSKAILQRKASNEEGRMLACSF